MAFVEIEQKYRLKDPAKTRALLKKIGARKIASGVELNEFYDKGDFLKKQKVALRFRRFGKQPATLTLKGPRIRSRFTKRMEIETPMDPATAKAFLAKGARVFIGDLDDLSRLHLTVPPEMFYLVFLKQELYTLAHGIGNLTAAPDYGREIGFCLRGRDAVISCMLQVLENTCAF